jgi:hypothetical protein
MGQVGGCPELVQITYPFAACFSFAHLAFCAAAIFPTSGKTSFYDGAY